MTMWAGQGGGRLGAVAMRLAHTIGATALADRFGALGFSRLEAGRLEASRGCLLMLHRVAPADQWANLPNRDFHIDAAFLGRALDYLVGTGWAVVTMTEAVSRIRAGDGRRFVNVSIDDVYRDSIEIAVPIFRSRNLPVTLFVTTGIPDRTMSLWAAGLETILLERGTVTLDDSTTADAHSAAQKRRLFARLSAAWEADRPEARYAGFCALNGYDIGALHDRHAVTWDMLNALRNDPCVEIGGHTMTHPRLSALPADRVQSEIAGCRARLQDRLSRPVQHFAFPYGRQADCGEREFAITRAAGFASAATTRKGLVGVRDRDRLHALPRNTLNGAHRHTAQLEVHLSGLGGLIARGLRAV